MTWDELVKVALIGTDRSNLSALAKQALKDHGVDLSADHAKVLLDGAALFASIQKSGSLPRPWEKALPEKAPPTDGKFCSDKSRRHLQLILRGEYLDLLPEFVYHLQKEDKRFPLDLLPNLLQKSTADPDLWMLLRKAIGPRGHWLIRQNPDWSGLLFDPKTVDWETGTREERIALLKHLRIHDPAQARTYIRATWKEDDLKSKAAFVKTLQVGLSIYDEPFLEEALDNSRKEIRKGAAGVLTYLPQSKRTHRMFERLQHYISLSSSGKKEKVKIQLPDDAGPDLIRDGIDPASRWYKGGVKASRLGQMIAVIPPKRWEDYFARDATETLKLFTKTDWSELLLQALTEATIIHEDMNWAEAILLFWLENFSKARWQHFNPVRLFASIDKKVFNKVALIHIHDKKKLLDEESPLTLLLRNVNLPWQDLLSKSFIEALKDFIAGETSHYWNGWHLRPLLKKAAIYTNPKLLDQLSKGWSANSYAWNSWEKDVGRFLSVLKFRKDMISALQSE